MRQIVPKVVFALKSTDWIDGTVESGGGQNGMLNTCLGDAWECARVGQIEGAGELIRRRRGRQSGSVERRGEEFSRTRGETAVYLESNDGLVGWGRCRCVVITLGRGGRDQPGASIDSPFALGTG